MENIIEIKTDKNVYRFIETLYKIENGTCIRIAEFKYSGQKIKLKLEMDEHNPPHVHIIFNEKFKFRYRFDKNDFFEKDILNNEGFYKFKKNKHLIDTVLHYLYIRQNDLIESFYILNPSLKTK